jgi:SNF2 family DNA or RNA helicase
VKNWEEEFEKFLPSALNVRTYLGDKDTRTAFHKEISKAVLAQPKEQRRDPKLPFHVLITTYEV